MGILAKFAIGNYNMTAFVFPYSLISFLLDYFPTVTRLRLSTLSIHTANVSTLNSKTQTFFIVPLLKQADMKKKRDYNKK